MTRQKVQSRAAFNAVLAKTCLPAEMSENFDILIVNETEAEILTGLTEKVV